MSEPVHVSDYDNAWPHVFEALRDHLAESLRDVALSIEHVGSTAVPGLAAKPTIDIDVVVASPRDVPPAIARLESLGYRHEGDLGVPGREAFGAPDGVPAHHHHLYVVVEGSPAHENHILLRDHLRMHTDDAAGYARLKRSLAVRYRNDRDAYTEAKSSWIDELLRRARGRRGVAGGG
jgi:GrpB-like predicted nucleotidyltransferase (UPF0157 family)